ncbi:hypothetical protein F4776DRAFT_675748 [Hypoxylon sp. NC0597]|nr:hypothetical protein F4776DRAFT_675748 [Hypoxylon sp. NC0597]
MSARYEPQWPGTSEAVRNLLQIQHGDLLNCHGRAKHKSSCSNRLSKATAAKIAELTGSIATSGGVTLQVPQILKKLASAVMCKRWHQDQSRSKAKLWEQELNSIAISPKCGQSSTFSQNRPVPETPPAEDKTSRIPRPPKTPSSLPLRHTFEYYCREKTFFEINLEVKHQLMIPLRNTEFVPGSIYAFSLPASHMVNGKSSREYVKIGYSNNVHRRLAEICRDCQYQPCLIGIWEMPSPRRYERIVHLLLGSVRMSEPAGCPGCHISHREWFKFNIKGIRDLIRSWQQWAILKPYSNEGYLLLKWQKRLDQLDLSHSTCWASFMSDRF